jgi:endonuclease/exonuclease/phosphatase family metal-dependent hydrolase
MFMGDFNFYRSLADRNKPSGNLNDVFIFNEVISNLGLQEIPLKGRKITWSNMQEDPLLEQIDWCFTSTNWISNYPNTLWLPLSKPTSDHIPWMVQIDTDIPKADVFWFEIFGLTSHTSLRLCKTLGTQKLEQLIVLPR